MDVNLSHMAKYLHSNTCISVCRTGQAELKTDSEGFMQRSGGWEEAGGAGRAKG